MKIEKAITILEEQKTKISDGMEPDIWQQTTSEILKKIFPKTGESKAIQIFKIYFIPLYPNDSFKTKNILTKVTEEAKKYMNEYISELKNFGIEKLIDEHPFIQIIKNPYFYLVIVTFISGSFFLGKEIGISRFDSEKIEMQKVIDKKEIEIRLQKESIIKLENKLSKSMKN
ncbi:MULTISPECIES: hypothetical protein [unclassified Flavobacterium]|jgi:hypothetical protein|uniref:hypothetical protein n=1 Tax=unclassified Flavobacterium TaxID=196869 RepID=UPI0025C13059|nr:MULTISPECIES: hypothetical protein [unclassified Flavobacterium]